MPLFRLYGVHGAKDAYLALDEVEFVSCAVENQPQSDIREVFNVTDTGRTSQASEDLTS